MRGRAALGADVVGGMKRGRICHIVKPINGGTPFAFVRSRYGNASWVRTDVCVPMVACGACGAQRGFCCVGRNGIETASTHADRKTASFRTGARVQFERATSITVDLSRFYR